MISISPGISVLAAGLVSGLCFILINGIRRGRASIAEKEAKKNKAVDDTRCACCLKPFLVGRGVQCEECGARACRKGCSRWNTPENAWYCLFCHQRRLWLRRNEKWFETFGGLPADQDAADHRFSTAKSQVFLGGADYAGVGPGVGLAAGGEEEEAGDSVERVREFVEKIVESLVGDVDEIPIDRLYDHQAYDQLVENYKEPLAGALARLAISLQLSISNKPATDAPTMAHAALRDLVERAVEEAKKLPGLGGSDAGRSADQVQSDISEQTYEDLLATAILNKVIEKYQHERVDGNSNTLHDNKSASRAKYITSEIEVGLDEGVEEGSSSLEPLSQDEYSSDCSAPAPKYTVTRQEPLSLTIEEHIEEVTTTYTSDEEEERDNEEANGLDFRKAHRVPFPEFGMDIIDPSQESSEETPDEATTPTHVDLVTPVESWEENWLFQKKKMQAQSEPVSMLVPNPSEDFKPLIGDREADDTSDLSDCSAQSDEEIEEELLEAINNVALKTPGTPEARPSLDVEELVEIRSNGTRIEETRVRTESGKTTITIGERNSKTNVQTNGISRVQLNGENEQKAENLTPQGKEIKLGLEDMLVFHLKNERSSKIGKGDSAEFIEREKSSVLLNQEIDDVDGAAVAIRSQSEIQDLITDAMEVVKPAIEAQVTRDLRMDDNLHGRSSDVEAVLEPVQSDPLKDQVVEDEAVIPLDKDHDNVPRTPTSSPLRLSETSATETGPHIDLRSLDEKLVSIETRVDKRQNSLEETANDVQTTEVVRSLNSVGTNSTVKDHVVEARLILVASGSEDGNSVRNELHGIDHHNEDGAQQESEYTEHYATATQRHLDSLTRPARTLNEDLDDDIPPPIPSTPPPITRLKQCRKAAALATVEIDETLAVERKRVELDLSLATPPRPGTIAEREHKKWENAAPIENNPYSEENIQKRLWQRQYSRKLSSDTSAGESSETPKTAGTPLQVVLGAGQTDLKRYGRDYYINEAKRASGERIRRSAMLNSGRPNSSLSQNSGSYDEDLEPQVSYGLDRFEEASLRGSLHRRSFRGQNSSSQFVTNPLLHLQVGEGDDTDHIVQVNELNHHRNSDSVTNESIDNASSDTIEMESSKDGSNIPVNETVAKDTEIKIIHDEYSGCKYVVNPLNVCYYRGGNYQDDFNEQNTGIECPEKPANISDMLIEGDDGQLQAVNDDGKVVALEPQNFRRLFRAGDAVESFAVNPLYDIEDNFPTRANLVDRDSGMYSIDSNDVTESGGNRSEAPKRLSVDGSKKCDENQEVSSQSKRYSDFGSFKFHTFGGIKRRRFNWNNLKEEYDETDSENEDMAEYPDDISDFGSMKCQTFGGIKQKTKFDGKKIAKYHKVKLRPALLFRDAKDAKSQTKQQTRSESMEDMLHSNFETRRDPSYRKFKEARSSLNGERTKKKRQSHEITTRNVLAERNVGDENLMANFLRDALMRPKSRMSTDNESIYSLDTTTRKSNGVRRKARRETSPSLERDDNSLRLEPPTTPEVIQKSFETLAGLRRSRSLKSERNSILSDSGSLRRKIPENISMW